MFVGRLGTGTRRIMYAGMFVGMCVRDELRVVIACVRGGVVGRAMRLWGANSSAYSVVDGHSSFCQALLR